MPLCCGVELTVCFLFYLFQFEDIGLFLEQILLVHYLLGIIYQGSLFPTLQQRQENRRRRSNTSNSKDDISKTSHLQRIKTFVNS